jgi:hypothetical protein
MVQSQEPSPQPKIKKETSYASSSGTYAGTPETTHVPDSSLAQSTALRCEQLERQLAILLQKVDTFESLQEESRPSSSTGSPRRLFRANAPMVFSGDRNHARNFLFQVEINFDSQPDSFSVLSHRLSFTASYLAGNALSWYQQQIVNKGQEFSDWSEFKRFFLATYGMDEVIEEDAACRKIFECKQETSVSAYGTLFTRLAAFTKIDNYTLCKKFTIGLKQEIQQHLLSLPSPPVTLADLIQAATTYDDLQFSIKRQIVGEKRPYPSSRPHISTRLGLRPGNIPIAATTVSPRSSQTPSPAERQRRRDLGLCRYCGIEGCPGSSNTADCSILAKNGKFSQGKGGQA